MDDEQIRFISVGDFDLQQFDEDPDGDENRAGDGWYFQLPDEDGWNGPWHSETKAETEIADYLDGRDFKNAREELLNAGFKRVLTQASHCERYARSDVEDQFVVIELPDDASVADRSVVISSCGVTFENAGSSRISDKDILADGSGRVAVFPDVLEHASRIEVVNGGDSYGHLQVATRLAVEAAKAISLPSADGSSPRF